MDFSCMGVGSDMFIRAIAAFVPACSAIPETRMRSPRHSRQRFDPRLATPLRGHRSHEEDRRGEP